MRETNYFTMDYLSRGRWISYWYQLKEVTSLADVKSILEIGPGNKIVSRILSKIGYKVKIMDLDANANPDFVQDIRNLENVPLNSFDLILCCQVLEHIPHADFCRALKNLQNLSKRYLIISLPYTSRGTFKPYLKLKVIPFLKPVSWIRIFNIFPQQHSFHGQHYWEIGKRGYKLKKILEDISNCGFKIRRHYPIFENPYHYMIICEKY